MIGESERIKRKHLENESNFSLQFFFPTIQKVKNVIRPFSQWGAYILTHAQTDMNTVLPEKNF